jgi:hypothetical protein
MDRRPQHSEGKPSPSLSIGGKKRRADSSGWAPKRRGDGVYRLKEGNWLRKKRSLDIKFEDEKDGKRQGSRAVLIFGVLAMLVIVCASLWFFKKRTSTREVSISSTGHSSRAFEVSQAEVSAVSAKDWKGALPIDAAEGFTRAKTIDERLKWVRDPARVDPMMRAFYSTGPGAKETVSGLVPMIAVQRGDLHYERFRADLVGGRNRLVCVVLTDEGGKVDFESYARHGSVPWEDLLDGRVTAADEVRLFVSRGDYYNFGFSDDGQWSNFIARTPDLDDDLQVYARRGSQVETTLSELTAAGPSPVTLAVRSVDQSHERNQLEATRVLATAWVVDRSSLENGP